MCKHYLLFDVSPLTGFNFKLFARYAAIAYENVGDPTYALDEVFYIFYSYFWKYEQIFKRAHPAIRIKQIERIIREMPSAGSELLGDHIRLDPDDYKTLIDAHFRTKYRNCDYNINHFFSGNIRALRYYEELC